MMIALWTESGKGQSKDRAMKATAVANMYPVRWGN